MAGPLLPLMLLGGTFWFLDRENERQLVSPQPVFTPQALAEVSEIRERIRFIRPEIVPNLEPIFAVQALEPVEVDGAEIPGLLYRAAPMHPGAMSVLDALDAAKAEGLAVLCSLSTALIGAKEDKLLWFVPPEHKRIASAASQFAVLQDTAALPATEVVTVEEPAPKRKRAKKIEIIETESNGVATTHEPIVSPSPNGKVAEA